MNAKHLPKEKINEVADNFDDYCKMFGYKPKGRLLTNNEAAALCGFKPNTLEQKRMNGSGPPYIQPERSRRVLYSEPLLLDWLAACLRTNTCA